MDSPSNIFGRRTCVIITGAGRGLGRSIAKTFASKFPQTSFFIFLARNLESLESSRTEIGQFAPGLKIALKQFDQGHLDSAVFDNLIQDILKEHGLSPSDFQQACIVHNSGTLGDNTKYTRQLSDVDVVRTNFDVNVSGVILLNSCFLRTFCDEKQHRIVVHISSLCAIKPFPSFSLYCTGKAARDMFFQTLAAEEPSIQVLSYAPGPCETDMQKLCREDSGDKQTKEMFQKLHKDGSTLTCDESCQKLVQILEKDMYTSGAHIDYYDDLDGHPAGKN